MKKFFAVILFFASSLPFKHVFANSFFENPVFFVGAQGNLNFASVEGGEKAGGFGGGILLEGGVDFNALQFSGSVAFDHAGSGGKVDNLNETKIGVAAAYLFDARNFPSLPKFIAIRAQTAFWLDIYYGTVYKSASTKNAGQSDSVSGVSFAFAPIVAVEFPNLIFVKDFNIVPYVSLSEIMRPENEGLLLSTSVSLGARLYFSKLGGK
ncbi:MAG: hypothetical protein IK015_06420 [Treponema sp.]|nr:hypothetical protein [Treponema sp.]